MIFDLIWSIVHAVLDPLVGTLPEGELGVPVLDAIFGTLGTINSVIPIAGPIGAALTMLSLLAIWFSIRMALMIWRQVPFT